MSSYQHIFERHQTCVLIPTYNNATTIASVIESVQGFTSNILVINDGSTDDTIEQLKNFANIHVVSYEQNKGKGHALKTGFRAATSLGYRYAITIDSDGQHFATDLPQFLEAIEQYPDALIIGARNMDQAHIPGKSTFGNRFSNFWFWVETGIRLPDTQSGYRLYPVRQLAAMKFFTRKYEFEIEVPVRAAWRGIKVMAVPVKVYYPPSEERISHFRPFKDFSRISVLNTVLTFTALLWIHPRNFVKKLTRKDGWKALYEQAFKDPNESRQKKALSIAFGIFMGIVPVWGFQLAIGIPLSIFFRMNKALFLIAANISIFPITPIIWALSLLTGKIILGYDDWTLNWGDTTLEQFKEAGIAFFLGGTVLAIVASLLAYLLSIILIKKGSN
jgi:glycosyltransferase involved in cell wall biosynthesis